MARGRKTQIDITLTPEQHRVLESWQRSTLISAGKARRGRLILLLAQKVPVSHVALRVGIGRRKVYKWAERFQEQGLEGLSDKPGRGRKLFFSPAIALHTVKVACERPDEVGQSLSQWFCADLAGHLMREGLVPFISASTVRRILEHHKLKPWRHHLWLSPKPSDLCLGSIIYFRRNRHRRKRPSRDR